MPKRNLNSIEIPVVKCSWQIHSVVILIFSSISIEGSKVATQALCTSFCNHWYPLEKCKFACGNLYYDIFPLLHSPFLSLQTQQHVRTTITICIKIRNNKLINSIFIFPQFINHLWMFVFNWDNKNHWWWCHLKHSIWIRYVSIDTSKHRHLCRAPIRSSI